VDRSIEDPRVFIETNVLGTQVLLEAARKHGIPRFVQISTDEVYGSLGRRGSFKETSPLAPNSPYSASKTAADFLVRAYHKTYGLAAIVTRCSNNYGPYQFPEKLIPLMISNALEDKPLPIYGDGMNVRDWIYVEDHCRAIDLIMRKGKGGDVYNIGADNELPNIEIVKIILKRLNRPESLIKFVKDRPGHDRRYAIDSTKLRKDLGWDVVYSFEDGINRTMRWYVENRQWWEKIKSGEYLSYYERMYGHRL
jgi:dTDP-glucose 4,6-dehydratase